MPGTTDVVKVDLPIMAPREAILLYCVIRDSQWGTYKGPTWRSMRNHRLTAVIESAMWEAQNQYKGRSYGVSCISRFEIDPKKHRTPLYNFAVYLSRVWMDAGITRADPRWPNRIIVDLPPLAEWIAAVSLLWDDEHERRWITER